MAELSDSSLHEDTHGLVEEYENRGSEDELLRTDEAEEDVEGRDNKEDEGMETNARRVNPATSKHAVRNPQFKLNTERLKGPKGIHTLEKYFEGFKFHGKGHEKSDLDRIMMRVEYWAHRLFPKFDYDDFLSKMETLGTKKDLQVFVKKYRMDMITADEDNSLTEIIDNEEEEKEDNVPLNNFDILIEEQIDKQKQAAIQQESLNNSANENTFNRLLMTSNSQGSQPPKENLPSELTEEVKARIEKNRQQAIQRRQARLKQLAEEAEKKKMKETENTERSQETIETNIPTQ